MTRPPRRPPGVEPVGASPAWRRWTKGQPRPGRTARDSVCFVRPLRTAQNGKLIIVYFWNFLLNVVGLRLKASHKPWKAKPRHKRPGQKRPALQPTLRPHRCVLTRPACPGGARGAGGHLVPRSGSRRRGLVSRLWSGAWGRDRPTARPSHLTEEDGSMAGRKISAFQAKPEPPSRIFFSYSISLCDDFKLKVVLC